MPVVVKNVPKQNLSQYRVWQIDTGSNSTYFALSQVPNTLTAGKNFFLIAGTNFLVPTTEVLVEILDINGSSVFLSPIPNYQEGLSRAVSIEIYSSSAAGPATLTILGELKTDVFGNSPPTEFVNKYNVKYQQIININPSAQNISPIRTYVYPTASAQERIVAYSDSTHSIVTINQGTITGIATSVNNSQLKNYYAIQLSNAPSQSFTNEIVGGTVLANINGVSFTSSVVKVLNSSILFVNMGYTGSTAAYQQFSTNTYSINYTSSASLIPTQYTRSYADISVSGLETFSGNVYRIKTYVAPSNDPLSWELVDDSLTKPLSLTATRSAQNTITEVGYVKSQADVSSHFIYGFLSDSGSFYK